jgi:hypothetical protein
VRGGTCKPSIETTIEHEIFSRRVAHCPEIPDRIAAKERLGEAPDFARKGELPGNGMRDRKCLSKLTSPHRPLAQFIKESVRVIVKSLNIGAAQDQKRIGRAPKIKFWRASIKHTMEVTDRHRRRRTFTVPHYCLCAQENVRHAV